MLQAGKHGNDRELAEAEKVNETYISRALRLTLLAPDIGEGDCGGAAVRRGHAAGGDAGHGH